jgi:hypothetical protein
VWGPKPEAIPQSGTFADRVYQWLCTREYGFVLPAFRGITIAVQPNLEWSDDPTNRAIHAIEKLEASGLIAVKRGKDIPGCPLGLAIRIVSVGLILRNRHAPEGIVP